MLFARTRTSGGKATGLFITVAAMAAVFVFPVEAASKQPSTDSSEVEVTRNNYGFTSAEICFMRKINGVRQRNGLGPLRWDKQMGYVARKHARQMSNNGNVYHDENMGSEITRWRRLGQNTGGGRSCRSLSRSFMRSPSHRANILGAWKYIGVGTANRGSKVYVQQIFENYDDPGNVYHFP